MLRVILDTVFGISLLIGAIYLWFVADSFAKFEKYQNVDSDFWPKILLAVFVVLSVCLLFQNVRILINEFHKNREEGSRKEIPSKTAEKVNWKMFTAMSLMCLLYFWGLQILGFIISTTIFLRISSSIIGVKGRIQKYLFPILFTSIVAILFVKVLNLSLPRGAGIFREFSLLFY